MSIRFFNYLWIYHRTAFATFGNWFKITCDVKYGFLIAAKMAASIHSTFEFVMQDPNERFSRETQTKIRKQAMRAVGAARRKSDRSRSPSPTNTPKYRIRRDSDIAQLLYPMPVSGLELLVKDRGFDPVDLSGLASVHIGTM